jgi:hypothetical protein
MRSHLTHLTHIHKIAIALPTSPKSDRIPTPLKQRFLRSASLSHPHSPKAIPRSLFAIALPHPKTAIPTERFAIASPNPQTAIPRSLFAIASPNTPNKRSHLLHIPKRDRTPHFQTSDLTPTHPKKRFLGRFSLSHPTSQTAIPRSLFAIAPHIPNSDS